MKIKSIYKILFLSSILFFLFPVISAKAARLYFDPSAGNFSPDAPISVDLRIDTENQSVNSIEGHLNFSSDIFSIEKLSDGGSIVSFWVAPAKSENGEITFAGIIPGGYLGQNGLLLKIYLKPKKAGEGEINIKPNSLVLLNDGQGTPVKLAISNFKSLISDLILNTKIPDTKNDTEPPESFIPQIGRESDIFDNKWFLVFATQDKNSGLDYYEVKEVRHFRFWERGFWKKQSEVSWQKAESPYLLKDQDLKNNIYVKAVDKSGNEMIVMLPARLKPWYQKPLVDIAIGLIIVFVVLLTRRLWKKNTKYRE